LYGPFPPSAVAVSVVVPPLQIITFAIGANSTILGCVMVTEVVFVQLFASLMVQV
jgi:hypothetical protein